MGNIIAAIAVLGALGALFGLILSVASKIFEVKKDPREEAILSHLAGANCGGCGYPGCAGCAAAILAGNAPVNACAPAGPDNAAAIAEIMGMAAPTGERQVAFVRCNGGAGIQIFPADYGVGMLTLPVGGFLVLACLIAAMQWALARPKKDKDCLLYTSDAADE